MEKTESIIKRLIMIHIHARNLFSMKYCCCFLLLFITSFNVVAQATTGFDSLSIIKPKPRKASYELQNAPLSIVQLKWKNPKRSKHTLGNMAGDGARNLLTSILGGHNTTAQSMDWQMSQELNTNVDSLNWKIDLFCSGELEKESHRVKNDDGSHSLDTKKTAHLFWEKGTSGYVLEKEDTIMQFVVALSPFNNTSFNEEKNTIYLERQMGASDPGGYNFTGANYYLNGRFRDQNLEVFFNGSVHKAWMYVDKKLLAMFQTTNEGESRNRRIDKKAARIAPYFLYDKGSSISLTDLLRLGMMGLLIEESVSHNSWERNIF
jgi:hypothetical protein